MGDHDAAGEHQLFDIAQAQRETVVEPDTVADDVGQANNLTMPFGGRPVREFVPLFVKKRARVQLTAPDVVVE